MRWVRRTGALRRGLAVGVALVATSCTSIPDEAPAGTAVVSIPWDARVVAIDGKVARSRARKRVDLPVGLHEITVTARHEHARGPYRQKIQIGCSMAIVFESQIYRISHELEPARDGTLLLNPDFIIRLHRMSDDQVIASCFGNVSEWKVIP